MAKATAHNVSDSEGESDHPPASKKTSASASSKSASAARNGRAAAEDDDDQGEDDGNASGTPETEYEIEKILEAKHGAFPEGRIGYYVKWKGYDDTDNSWVDEIDAQGAKDLIDAFWSKSKQRGAQRAKPGPKSVTKARGKKGRADDDDEEEEESGVEESPAPPKKRSRPSKASTAASRDSSEEPAPEPAPKKKPRKSAGTSFKSASTASKGKRGGTSASAARGADPDEDDGEDDFADMKQLFKTALSWENSVEKIDTVERTPGGGLIVYFTLKNGMGHGREPAEICKQKMPHKLIDFYESNLRWKTIEDAMDEDD